MTSLLKQDAVRLKRLAKRGWWIGVALGLVCHLVPPEYQAACKAIADACSNLIP
jgi:hypothetical protein